MYTTDIVTLPRFCIGRDTLARFPSLCRPMGRCFAVVGGVTAMDRALPALRRAAEDPHVNYLDFVEISSAIEALGGERPAEREFAGDPYYESLKHV